MSKIAIVGAGFAGLAVGWHLLQIAGVEVTFFDPLGPGGGASGVSTGLLHPFPGRLALRSWQSSEGMGASIELLRVAEKALGRPVCSESGIVRAALLKSQRKAFYARAKEDPEVIWLDDIRERIPEAANVPGIWIPGGISVYSRVYIEGLWKAQAERGAKLERVRINSLGELDKYDRIVVAAGADALRFPECAELPLEIVKGQAISCHWDAIPSAIIGVGAHITPAEDPGLCHIGSTYERDDQKALTPGEAAEVLLQKVAEFYPPARGFRVVAQEAGFRLSPLEGYKPLTFNILNSKVWVFIGLGSRGLLYHALLGKRVAEEVLKA